jgi:hypothetical protein
MSSRHRDYLVNHKDFSFIYCLLKNATSSSAYLLSVRIEIVINGLEGRWKQIIVSSSSEVSGCYKRNRQFQNSIRTKVLFIQSKY